MASSFLSEPEPTAATRALYAGDRSGRYVMNLSRMWAHQPAGTTCCSP